MLFNQYCSHFIGLCLGIDLGLCVCVVWKHRNNRNNESAITRKMFNQIEFFSGEVWVNEVTSDPDYKTDFKLDTLSNKDDSKGSGTVDITKEKLGKDKKKAEEKNDDEEMDIYEDVMKLEIKTQPLVQAIVLSDDDNDNVAEETERDAEKQNMDADKLKKTNAALPADKNLETGSKTLNGNRTKIASLEETSGS